MELTEAEIEELAEPVYDAYRLGKYGTEEYLPMWHELDKKPTGTPEMTRIMVAVERMITERVAKDR